MAMAYIPLNSYLQEVRVSEIWVGNMLCFILLSNFITLSYLSVFLLCLVLNIFLLCWIRYLGLLVDATWICCQNCFLLKIRMQPIQNYRESHRKEFVKDSLRALMMRWSLHTSGQFSNIAFP